MGFSNELYSASAEISPMKYRFSTLTYYIRKLAFFSLESVAGNSYYFRNFYTKFFYRKEFFNERKVLILYIVLCSLNLNDKIFFVSKCQPFFNTLFKSVDFPIRLLSHELNSAFFNIKSYLEIIYEYNYSLREDQLLNFLESTNTEIYRANLITNNILGGSKITIQDSIFSLENLSFVFLLMDSYRLNLLQKKVLFYSNNFYFLHTVRCNPLLIQQVVSNFLNNSLRFTISGGKLMLRFNKGFILNFIDLEIRTFLRFGLIDNGLGASSYILSLCENKIGYKILTGFLRVHGSESYYYRLLFRGNLGFFNLIN